MKDYLTGNMATRECWLNGHLLDPAKSQSIVNHSPDGFNWGYAGSGPAQLALAVLLELTDREFAERYYMKFKFQFIASLPQISFAIPIADIKQWAATIEAAEERGDN